MTAQPVPMVLDCDPGLDDAIAIMVALGSPEVDVLAITTVAGNAPLRHTTANAIRVLDHLDRADVPVAAGADRPLVREAHAERGVHGDTGLGDLDLPPPSRLPAAAHAIDLMAELATSSARPVTLVAVGPLTNVALFAARHPQAAAALDRVVVMGGSIGLGNTTPAAEFNIWADPEAAQRVLTSGLDVTMVGLDVTQRALLTPEENDRLRGRGRAGRLAAGLVDFYQRSNPGRPGVPIHDAVAVAQVVRPEIVELSECHVEVDCGAASRGRTLVDLRGVTGNEPNARVAVEIDAAFTAFMADRIAALG